jgi:plasminogen activator inhibitor 1 RNA-binding protein
MATLNPFDILGADDNDDPSQLMAAAAAAAAKKAATAPAGKGTQAPAAAKLPTKPAPPTQAGELPWS